MPLRRFVAMERLCRLDWWATSHGVFQDELLYAKGMLEMCEFPPQSFCPIFFDVMRNFQSSLDVKSGMPCAFGSGFHEHSPRLRLRGLVSTLIFSLIAYTILLAY